MSGGITQKYTLVKDRIEIYKDFTMNLLYYIDHYYIDWESLCNDQDMLNHFNWCFDKVCDEFLLEEINFKDNKRLREYFYSYYYNQYYKQKGNPNIDTSLAVFEKFWKPIFEFEKQKNKNLTNILIEIYSVFDKSISREKNILEIV
jgi:hypothetical protein